MKTEFADNMEMLQYYGLLLLNVICFLLVAVVVLASCRFIIRYIHHIIRKAYLGDTIWHEVIFEGGVSEKELVKADGQVKNMQNIMVSTMSRWLGILYFNRSMTSLMIRKSDEDDSTHMYIGMRRKGYRKGMLSAWEQGSNCSVEEVDFDSIGFVPNAPTTAVVNNFIPRKFEDSPTNSTIGGVISRLQDLLPDGQAGTALITFEPMRNSEKRILTSHITEDSIKNTRVQDGTYNKVGDYIENFRSNSPSRGVIIGFSDEGYEEQSDSIVNTTINSMSSIGVERDNRTYTDIHRRTGLVLLPITILLGVLGYFNLIPLWMAIVAAVFNVSTLLGIKYLSTFWIEKACSDGFAPIPPFWRFSLRRIYREWFMKMNPFDYDAADKWKSQENPDAVKMKYTEKPSCKEVFPFYTTSLMQFLSMPLSGKGTTNVSRSVIPQVAMPNSANNNIQNIINSNDVSYIGISAKSHEPVYRTPKDLNFGVAIGGTPGSGKTNLSKCLFLEDCRLGRKETGLFGQKNPDGSRKVTINPIWFETKADDLSDLTNEVERYKPLVVSLHNPHSATRLALEGKRYSDEGVTIEDIQTQRGLFVAAMEAIWDSSFMHRSKNIASHALMICYLMDEQDMKALKIYDRIDNPERPNIMQLMAYLIGSHQEIDMESCLKDYHKALDFLLSTEQGEVLLQQKIAKAKHSEKELTRLKVLSVSIGALLNMYKLSEAMGPLQSKIPILAQSGGLFDTHLKSGEQRKEFPLDDLFTYGGPVIVDMTTDGSTLNFDDTRMFVMLVHYMLWQRLRIRAHGWAAQGKYTRLYADEITNFTGRADDNAPCATIIGEVKDQGRSYGVSHTVGYQNFDQLPPDTRASVLSFDSSIFFRFDSAADQNEVINQINSDRYVLENIRSFPVGVGIALIRVNRKAIQPFTIKTPFFKTWSEAVYDNKEDMSMAFQSIRRDEVEFMRNEKKKKVDDVVYEEESYEEDNSYSLFEQEHTQGIEDDGIPPLRWG